MVSDDESDGDSISAPQVSEVEPLGDDGPTASPILPEPPPHKSSEEDPEGAQSEEDPEGETPGCTIWERDKNNHLRISNIHQILHALTCHHHQQCINLKQLTKKRQSLKHKQCKLKLCEGGDYTLNKTSLEHKIPTFSNLMESPLDIFITFVVNNFVCEGTTK